MTVADGFGEGGDGLVVGAAVDGVGGGVLAAVGALLEQAEGESEETTADMRAEDSDDASDAIDADVRACPSASFTPVASVSFAAVVEADPTTSSRPTPSA